jgi:hypothetical protein
VPGRPPGNVSAAAGREGAAKELLAWDDGTPKADVQVVLQGEVELEMMLRMVGQAAGVAGRSA